MTITSRLNLLGFHVFDWYEGEREREKEEKEGREEGGRGKEEERGKGKKREEGLETEVRLASERPRRAQRGVSRELAMKYVRYAFRFSGRSGPGFLRVKSRVWAT
jgi:hypothetical protein